MDWSRGPAIGRGSTATISLATSTQTGDVFAVKSTVLSQADSLRKEREFLSTLSCPQIVSYKGYSISSENGKILYNLFMEYAPGGNLQDEIRRHGGCLPVAMVRSYTRQILLGLEYLHSNGIVHCDIKAQNVLVTDSGVKIADLGCARRDDDEVSCADSPIAGTPVYMAPEVARGEQQGFPADVWALGCTLIEMVTGKAPWAADVSDPVSALYRIGFSTDVPEIPSFLPDEAKDFLGKCLNRDPSERWPVGKLLGHDFVKEKSNPVLKEINGSNLETPTSVLHQNFWDSMVEAEEIQNLTRKYSPTNSPAARIQLLSDGTSMPAWDWDEQWVTVRINHSVGNIMTMDNEECNLVNVDYPTCKFTNISALFRDLDLVNIRMFSYLHFLWPFAGLFLVDQVVNQILFFKFWTPITQDLNTKP